MEGFQQMTDHVYTRTNIIHKLYVYNCMYIYIYIYDYLSGGQNYILLAIDMAKVGGPLSVVKVL